MQSFWIRYQGTRFPLRRGETVVGRSPYCTVVLSNRLASRQHCSLRFDGDSLVVTDLDSANGTWVNGERVDKSRRLAHGDVVRVGTDVLQVLISDRTSSPPRARSITGNERAVSAPEMTDETSTQVDAFSVDVIEALAKSATATGRPAIMIAMVERALDTLLSDSRRALTRAEKLRLTAIIETVGEASTNGQSARWRVRMLDALDRSPSGCVR